MLRTYATVATARRLHVACQGECEQRVVQDANQPHLVERRCAFQRHLEECGRCWAQGEDRIQERATERHPEKTKGIVYRTATPGLAEKYASPAEHSCH